MGESIIEKLGISKNWQPTESLQIDNGICFETDNNEPENILIKNLEGYYVFYWKADRDLALAAPEMLEALIDFLSQMESIIVPENTKYKKDYYDNFLRTYDSLIKSVEKATGKSWQEIKELI